MTTSSGASVKLVSVLRLEVLFCMFKSLGKSGALRRLALIIGGLWLVLALEGCSAVRMGYNSAATLSYWWLDSYYDFDDAQSVHLRQDLALVHDWHRAQELPRIDQTLQQLQALARGNVNASQLCSVWGDVQRRALAPLERLAPTFAAIAPSLQDTQFTHMRAEFARRDRQWRQDWIDGSAEERLQRRLNLLRERVETLYGALESPQTDALRAALAQSSFSPERHFREIQRRHQDALQVLQAIRAGTIPPDKATAALIGVLHRSVQPPDPDDRHYLEQVTAQSCAALDSLHNSATPSQRKRLLETLQAYRDDIRALAPPSIRTP